MSPCQRYETEGLTGFPASPEFASHLTGCPDCQAVEQQYHRLEQLLVAPTHATAQPPTGWEQRLQRRLANAPARAWPRLLTGAAGLAAAAALAFVLYRPSAVTSPEPGLRGELVSTGTSRAAGAAVGQSWRFSFGRDQELRVWRSGTALVLRCPAPHEPRCEEHGGERTATVTFEVPGDYRAMALSTEPAAAAPVSLDDDARLAAERGVRFELMEPLTVY